MTQSQRGFTIIEVMLAVIVFSVGLLALASSAGVIMSSLTSTQMRTVATSVAEARIERLAATPCGSARKTTWACLANSSLSGLLKRSRRERG